MITRDLIDREDGCNDLANSCKTQQTSHLRRIVLELDGGVLLVQVTLGDAHFADVLLPRPVPAPPVRPVAGVEPAMESYRS